jgi:eukaryotic-like serine/threonine-protein kinase
MSTLRIADGIGRVLDGKYRLIRPVGAGASAYVYVAEEIQLRRRVAVKILHPGLAHDQAFLRRFRSEARAVAALQHPNILHVYAFGEDGDDPYLVTELLEGGSLRALLDTGNLLTWSQAAAVGLAAAQALQHANSRGLVHRDIKPANLLFDGEGRLHIADFGLARALAESSLTEPGGAVVGTARYAAPEQVMSGPADIRADVYALALVLTEATTSVVPFAADTWQGTLMARTRSSLEVPDAAGPLVPILKRAGTLDPNDRLDPLGLARALEGLLSTQPPPDPLPLAGLPTGEPGRDANPTMLRGMARRAATSSKPGPTGSAGELPSVLADPDDLVQARLHDEEDEGDATVAWAPGDDDDGGLPTQALPAVGGGPGGVYDGDADTQLSGPPDAVSRAAAIDAAADAAARWSQASERVRLNEEFDALIARRNGRDGARAPHDGVASERQWNAGAEAGWAGSPPAGWEPSDEEPPGDDEYEPRHRRRWLVWVAAAVVLFLLSGGGAFAWIETHQAAPLSVVPSLTGDTQAHARQVLTRDHLTLRVLGSSYDSHAAKGTILTGQNPPSGRQLRHGQVVAVTISRGPKPVGVPHVQGLTRYRAHKLLAAHGLKISKITRATSTTVATNLIISATPSSGTLLPGQGVAIVISTGKPSLQVPLLTGASVDSYAAAAAALEAQHLVPKEQKAYSSDGVPQGEVIVTDPAPHATVLWGSSITVLISKGPEMVMIPAVKGDTVTEADQALTNAGFVVSGVTGNPSRKVVSTNPAIGSSQVFGSSVQIVAAGSSSSTTTKSGKHHKKS